MGMRIYIASLTVVCLLLLIMPASAQVLYENGPVNGYMYAWTINFGYVVSDTFSLYDSAQVQQVDFWTWLINPNGFVSVGISVTSQENGGTVFFNQQVNTTVSGCFYNGYGYMVCEATAELKGLQLEAGSYWLNLQNANDGDQAPVYWDENSGIGCQSPGCPSAASESAVGTIPSESFTIGGCYRGQCEQTPEPYSILLFASGVAGLSGLWRKLSTSHL